MKDHPGGSTNLQAYPEKKGPPLEEQRRLNSNQKQIVKKAQRKKRRGWDKEKAREETDG